MTIKCVLYQAGTLKEGCSIALKNRLYVSGWNLSNNLKRARAIGKGEVSIVYLNEIPVACALVDEFGFVDTFCRKSERRKGYASLALSSLKHNEDLKGYYGVKGSQLFYLKAGVRYLGQL